MKRALLLLIVASLTTAGCASMRGVNVGSDSNDTYAIEVTNNRSSTVTVSYRAGDVSRQLGTVGARQAERFVIVGPSTPDISVLVSGSSGFSRTYSVHLEAGTTKRVTVQ